MILSEYAGHSAGVSTDLKTNDYLSGFNKLKTEQDKEDYVRARSNNDLSA